MPTVVQPTEEVSNAKSFSDFRIMEVMQFVIANRIKEISDEANFLKSIGYNSWRNLALIRKGVQHFQIEHIVNTCTVYNVSADFLLNKNCHKMFIDLGNETPMFRLKVAAKEVEILLKDLGNG